MNEKKPFFPPDGDWSTFGRWMSICSGIVFLTIAFYRGEDLVSLLLRIWSAFVGVYFLYAALRR